MTGKSCRSLLVLILVCAAIAAACAAQPAAAAVNVHVIVPAPYLVVTASDRHAGDVLLLTALAAYMGANVSVVLPLYPVWSVDDIAFILVIHRHTHRPIPYIIDLRKRHGWGWGQVAHRMGVHPGAFNQRRVWAKKHDYAVAEGLYVPAVQRYWALPPGEMRAMRARHYPPREIALAANVATRSGKPMGDVLKARSAKRSWQDVGGRFGVGAGQLGEPARGKGHFASPAAGKPSGRFGGVEQGSKPGKPGSWGAEGERGHGGGQGAMEKPGRGRGAEEQPGGGPGKGHSKGKGGSKGEDQPQGGGEGKGHGRGPK